MNILNDTETRVFLSAMSRETGVCKKLDEECPEGKNLEAVCNSIIAKVYRARPNIHAYWINKYDKDIECFLLHCSNCNGTSVRPYRFCRECGAEISNGENFKEA